MNIPRDRVMCLECGKLYKIISASHLANHNMTVSEYKEKYGNDVPFHSIERREQLSNRNRQSWTDPEYREKMTQKQRGVIAKQRKDPKFLEAIRYNGKKGWENATEEQKIARKEQARNQISKFNEDSWKDEEYRKYMAEKASNLEKEGVFVYKPNCRDIFIKSIGITVKVKSRWELCFILWCKEKGYSFDYEPLTVEWKKGSLYTPDFYIHELDAFFEIKGNVKGKVKEEMIRRKANKVAEVTGKDIFILKEDEMMELGILSYLNKARVLYNKKDHRIEV